MCPTAYNSGLLVGMPRRFPTLIDLTDYTAQEIAQIAQKVSLQKFNLTWEVGVEEQLALHILQHYADDISAQNGGLAVNIVETAVVSTCAPERSDGLFVYRC